MNKRHLAARLSYCHTLAELSPCPRAQYGALIIDSAKNIIISEGWNGPPRGPATSCGPNGCTRSELEIPSGQRCEVGCHHAEANAITNAARRGASTEGALLVVSGAPCLSCAKLIHHAGITQVIYQQAGRSKEGVLYLVSHGVKVHRIVN